MLLSHGPPDAPGGGPAAPAPHEVREDLAREADVAEELQVPALEPRLVGEVQEGPALRRARVVDEDVDAAEVLGGRAHPALDVLGPAEIGGIGEAGRAVPRTFGEAARYEDRLRAALC